MSAQMSQSHTKPVTVPVRVPDDLYAEVRRWARIKGKTPAMILQEAWADWLHAHQTTSQIGVAIRRRNWRERIAYMDGFDAGIRAVEEEILSEPLPPCDRCGHPADWHRLDDSLNLDPTDPATPFRCIGYDCMAPGKPLEGCTSRCPDYVLPARLVHDWVEQAHIAAHLEPPSRGQGE